MAKEKAGNSIVDDFLFKKPEKMEDGTIKTERYETGILMFDKLLNGGFPQGKVISLGAEEGVGKTTMLIQSLGNIAETYSKKCYYFDVEGGATYELFEALGYAHVLYDPLENPDGKLFLLNVTTIQDISRLIKKLTTDKDTAVIVIDTDTDVVDGNAMAEEDLGTSAKAAAINARMWSKAMPPIKAVVKESDVCLVIVHQARTDISGFMPKTVSSGGRAVRHATSVEIWGKRKGWIMPDYSLSKASKDKEKAIGASVKFTTEKNRLTKPFASISIPIFFGKGVSNKWAYKEWLEEHDWVDSVTGETIPFIAKKGSWFNIVLPSGLTAKVQGDPKVWEFVNEHYEEIVELVNSLGGITIEQGRPDIDDEDDMFNGD